MYNNMYSHVCVQTTPQNAIRKCQIRDFKNALHLYLLVLLPKRVIKNSLQQSSFRVSRNVIFSFPHTFRAHNAICVAYRVVVSYV